jgi:hypothetical protein
VTPTRVFAHPPEAVNGAATERVDGERGRGLSLQAVIDRLRRAAPPYPVVCTLIGLALGWLPTLVHGPIPEKFDVLYIRGAVAVWGYYVARCLIGFLVGVTVWPGRWWLRGPMCGLLMLLPLTIVALATPGCGPP